MMFIGKQSKLYLMTSYIIRKDCSSRGGGVLLAVNT